MNILQIVSSSRTSGAEKHVIVLSERLRQRGHQVVALCPPGGWLPEQLRAAGIPVVERLMHGTRFCTTAMRLPHFVREKQFDLIHTHLTCATYHGYLTGKLANLPVVSSVHVRTRDLVYRRLFPQRQNRIITVSEWVRKGLIEQGIPGPFVRTIYNGTEFLQEELAAIASPPDDLLSPPSAQDTHLPVRAELSLPPDAEVIGIFGQVNEFKGHPLLVRAARQIVTARPHAYFVCAGSVEPRTQRILWEMAAADSVAERFRFTGVRNDVRRLMAEMDVVTLPSRYEACSMSIIEAMAMGKPVVATRAGGNPELVLEEETGLLIERTQEALAEAIISLLKAPDRRQRMGDAARQRAVEHFSAGVMVDQVEALYRELVTSPAK